MFTFNYPGKFLLLTVQFVSFVMRANWFRITLYRIVQIKIKFQSGVRYSSHFLLLPWFCGLDRIRVKVAWGQKVFSRRQQSSKVLMYILFLLWKLKVFFFLVKKKKQISLSLCPAVRQHILHLVRERMRKIINRIPRCVLCQIMLTSRLYTFKL